GYSANRNPLRSNFPACRNVQLRRITRTLRRDFFEGLSVQVSVCPEWLPTFGEFLREFLLHLPPAQFFYLQLGRQADRSDSLHREVVVQERPCKQVSAKAAIHHHAEVSRR